jgi:AcrR family transcriptional regulator
MNNWDEFQTYILQLEQEGLATRTYRRLDPERQEAVLHAILDEATERGPAGTNIQNVARRAGVSVGSLYQYFGDRERMLSFAVELCVRYMVGVFEMGAPYLAEMPLREALTAYLSYGVEWSRTQSSLVRFFARAAYVGDADLAERLVTPVAEAMRAMVAAMLAAAVQRGEARPDLDIERAARTTHALLIVAGDSQLLPYLNHYFRVVGAQETPEAVTAAVVDMILHGIAKETL